MNEALRENLQHVLVAHHGDLMKLMKHFLILAVLMAGTYSLGADADRVRLILLRP